VSDSSGKVKVGTVAATLRDSGCKFCTACVEVCPTGAIRDIGMRNKDEDLLPCVAACPAGINIPWYLRFVAQGKADQALSVIREKVPLPGILGRVCVRPCEEACRRKEVNEPVSICGLKRFAADHAEDAWKAASFKRPDTGKKVAVVGSGPAGLTAAFYLRKLGHGVTIFDANEKPGGMMRYGIPRYRLPDAVLDKEIGEIFALGVDFQPGTSIGKDVTLKDLKNDYNAEFIATGAPLSRRISLDGAGLPQVLWGVDFLRNVSLGKDVSLAGKVVVIGGGAVAVDASLTARRLGAEEVHMVCLEDRREMPAHASEIQNAEDEGVMIHNCWGPLEVVEQDGAVKGICFTRCVCVFDSAGKFNPSFDNECTMGLAADTIILAIGQSTDLAFAFGEGVAVQANLVRVDDKSQETNVAGIFAGGDAVVFPGAIIHAVAAGRRAASAIDKYLGDAGEIGESLVKLPQPNPCLGREEGFADRPRISTRKVPVLERTGFDEVDLGFGSEDACSEASRCLQCDLRLAMTDVVLPPEHILAFTEENVEKVPEAEGAFRLMDETKKVIVIKGTENMRKLLSEYMQTTKRANYFDFEEDKMFSKRESELIQQHLQKYGEMPSGGEEDDLF
jgi:NADPH-dependent glutamate synthase beta subunit-like oxidoreductase